MGHLLRGPLVVFQIRGIMSKAPREKTRPGLTSLFSQHPLRRDEGSYLPSFTFEATVVYRDSCPFICFFVEEWVVVPDLSDFRWRATTTYWSFWGLRSTILWSRRPYNLMSLF